MENSCNPEDVKSSRSSDTELELAGNSHMSSLGEALIGCHEETDDTVVGLLLAEKMFSCCCFGGCRNILGFVFGNSDYILVGPLFGLKTFEFRYLR